MFAQSKPQIDFTKDSKFKMISTYFQFTDLKEYAQDFGHIVYKRPLAVFTPPTVEALQQFMKLASEYNILVTCRGRGNSAYGQSQVENGVIIDLQNIDISLNFDSDESTSVTVPAYKTWLEITNFTKQRNKTVPVTLDNLDLTAAGTLSFGALGGTSYLCGSGADNVLELKVVTLDGECHVCSKSENTELFDAVLCGMGQFGIIVSATIPLVTAKQNVNMHLISYDNPQQFLQDQKSLYESKAFDHLKGFITKKDGAWEYVIEAANYYDDHEHHHVAEALSKLTSQKREVRSMPYWEFINIVTGFVETLRKSGKLDAPHPWYNILMPEHEIENHLIKVLDTSHFTGSEPIIIYPMNSDHFRQPLFMKPDCQTFYLLGALYNTSFVATNDFPYQEVLNRNKDLYLEAKEKGGSRYAVDAVSFTAEDWANHYGAQWNHMCYLKEKYDPQHLLSTGVNIFEAVNLKNKHRFTNF